MRLCAFCGKELNGFCLELVGTPVIVCSLDCATSYGTLLKTNNAAEQAKLEQQYAEVFANNYAGITKPSVEDTLLAHSMGVTLASEYTPCTSTPEENQIKAFMESLQVYMDAKTERTF